MLLRVRMLRMLGARLRSYSCLAHRGPSGCRPALDTSHLPPTSSSLTHCMESWLQCTHRALRRVISRSNSCSWKACGGQEGLQGGPGGADQPGTESNKPERLLLGSPAHPYPLSGSQEVGEPLGAPKEASKKTHGLSLNSGPRWPLQGSGAEVCLKLSFT